MPELVAALGSSHGLSDCLVDRLNIEMIGSELTACPAAHCLVLFMLRIEPCFQKICIAGIPTYVLRRRGPYASNANFRLTQTRKRRRSTIW